MCFVQLVFGGVLCSRIGRSVHEKLSTKKEKKKVYWNLELQ